VTDQNEPLNYFNYFTEIEEHFQRTRGTSLFLLSPLDWALVESWKNSGVPLEAVLRGIDAAFEKWRGRKVKTQKINSLAFCAQAVLTEAQQTAGAASAETPATSPYTTDELRAYLGANADALRKTGGAAYSEIADALGRLSEKMDEYARDLERLEQHLTVLEEKMLALARAGQTEHELLEARRSLDTELRPYRSKMSAAQLAMLETQYLERRLLACQGLPRLSLFYLR
jgi:flagellar motility protein MotE (MotC chaperone)